MDLETLMQKRAVRLVLVWISVLLIVSALVAVFSRDAHAYDATVTWTNPTKNTDGTTIVATGPGSLTSTRIEYGSCLGTAFGTKTGEVVVPQPATSVVITGFAAASTACFQGYAKNTFGVESLVSNVVSKLFPTPTPQPPVLSSTITVAYELNLNGSSVKLGRVVGNIALGTPCEPLPIDTNKGTYYEVTLDRVQLITMPKSAIVVTACAAT